MPLLGDELLPSPSFLRPRPRLGHIDLGARSIVIALDALPQTAAPPVHAVGLGTSTRELNLADVAWEILIVHARQRCVEGG